MADTITLQIDPEKAEELRKIAAETGVSVEELAQRLFDVALDDMTGPYPELSDEQLADLDARLKDPGPMASAEEVDAFFARFKA
jgi:hypothetical protein